MKRLFLFILTLIIGLNLIFSQSTFEETSSIYQIDSIVSKYGDYEKAMQDIYKQHVSFRDGNYLYVLSYEPNRCGNGEFECRRAYFYRKDVNVGKWGFFSEETVLMHCNSTNIYFDRKNRHSQYGGNSFIERLDLCDGESLVLVFLGITCETNKTQLIVLRKISGRYFPIINTPLTEDNYFKYASREGNLFFDDSGGYVSFMFEDGNLKIDYYDNKNILIRFYHAEL